MFMYIGYEFYLLYFHPSLILNIIVDNYESNHYRTIYYLQICLCQNKYSFLDIVTNIKLTSDAHMVMTKYVTVNIVYEYIILR